jgi:hypothetical protein
MPSWKPTYKWKQKKQACPDGIYLRCATNVALIGRVYLRRLMINEEVKLRARCPDMAVKEWDGPLINPWLLICPRLHLVVELHPSKLEDCRKVAFDVIEGKVHQALFGSRE